MKTKALKLTSRGLAQFPRKGMLSATVADEQYTQTLPLHSDKERKIALSGGAKQDFKA